MKNKKITIAFKVKPKHKLSVQALVRKFLRSKGYKLYKHKLA